jgi:hypothetical protein
MINSHPNRKKERLTNLVISEVVSLTFQKFLDIVKAFNNLEKHQIGLRLQIINKFLELQ